MGNLHSTAWHISRSRRAIAHETKDDETDIAPELYTPRA